ncbi:MAG: NAD-dependent epimerase/dehydratase family protein [bacterium]
MRSDPPRRILLTGSSGQVGAAIAQRLALDYDVLGLDLIPGRHTTHLGNITDAVLIDSVMSQVDAVIHTASLHAPHVESRSRADFLSTNVEGTQRLLDAAIKHGISRFVYTSTTSLYGSAMVSTEKAMWVTEDLPPAPRDIYDETKLAAEAYCRAAARHGLPCLSLRISRCFRETDELMATYRLYRGVDLRDVAAAHRLALLMNLPRFEVFNISARTPFEAEDTTELLHNAPVVIRQRCPSFEWAFAKRGWHLPQSIDRVYVITKAEEILGFSPRYNYDAFLAESISSNDSHQRID